MFFNDAISVDRIAAIYNLPNHLDLYGYASPDNTSMFFGSTITLPRFQADVNEFTAWNTYVLSGYVAGDFNGTRSSHASFLSDTPGSYAILDLTNIGSIVVDYLDLTDIHVINGTITTRGGVDGGGNSGVTFAAAPGSVGIDGGMIIGIGVMLGGLGIGSIARKFRL
jgi:hypothetical protein